MEFNLNPGKTFQKTNSQQALSKMVKHTTKTMQTKMIQ